MTFTVQKYQLLHIYMSNYLKLQRWDYYFNTRKKDKRPG